MDGALLGPESSPEAFLDQDRKGRFILNKHGEAILFDRTALALVGGDPEKLLGQKFDPSDAGPLLREEGRTHEAVLYRARDPRPLKDAKAGIAGLEAEASRLAARAASATAAVERLRSLLAFAESNPDPRAFHGAAHLVARELFPKGGAIQAPHGTLSWGLQSGLGPSVDLGQGVNVIFPADDPTADPAVGQILGAIVALGLGV